ncbi:hypothetical protein [Arthrobacter sp. zg-Y1143]|uniref:hypothetical protein n=1 Tax=Arthrobacter sp. zg-Y1143 TaxID=3049065 RepID=UPI0024C3F36E|nr:hypothetical protein [Arthrobacter sp. zg-Y1143]MDK1328474.1 hypothetical protein [Arthrobacter sp. zg-Y1143]
MNGSDSGSGPHGSSRPEGSGHRRRRVVLAVAVAAAVVLGVFFAANAVRNDGGVPAVAASREATTQTPRATAAESGPAAEPAPAGTADPGTAAAQPAPGAEPVAPEDPSLAAQDLPVAEPVAIDGGSSEAGGLDIRVASMEAVEGEAIGIGEIGGPSVRFTVSVANGSNEPVDLSNAVLTVEAGPDRLPCTELSGPATAAFPVQAKPGETVTGIFVFLIPEESRNDVTVYLNYSVDASVAAFHGAVPAP